MAGLKLPIANMIPSNSLAGPTGDGRARGRAIAASAKLLLAVALQSVGAGALANPVADIVTAFEVSRIAEERANPLAYVVAVQLLPRVEALAPDGATPTGPSVDALRARWLDRARVLAGDRQDLLSLVDSLPNLRPKTAAAKVDAESMELGPRATRVLRKRFEGGKDAAAALMPSDGAGTSGQADVDLFVQDERGASVCSVERPGLPKLCRWAPRLSGEFTIRLVNRQNSRAGVLVYAR